VEDPTTIAMNLTFFGTLAVGLVLFLGVFVAFIITLLLAGVGRLMAVAVTAVAGGWSAAREAGGREPRGPAQPARPATAQPAGRMVRPAKPARPVRKEPQLSPEWTAAVARADERAQARAKAEAAPEISVSVRELPSPKAPVQEIEAVGPLVESATDRNGSATAPAAPRAFAKPPLPPTSPVLDTGSLTTLKHRPGRPDQQRKAS
jgi:hypothetical protein